MTMRELTAAFPANITEAIEIAQQAKFKNKYTGIQAVVICGMGGSGIGGTLVKDWLFEELKVPVVVIKDYDLPQFVGPSTLVIGSSYSGNTEETLIAIDDAIARQAQVVGICSGGQMQARCENNGFDYIVVPGGNPPRTALAYSLVQLLHIFHETGLISGEKLSTMAQAEALISREETEIHAIAKDLAKHLKSKVGIFYATSLYEGVITRARQQFNENSKYLCWHHVLPEMNHNELVGWGGGDERFALVYFKNEGINHRNAVRAEITLNKIREKAAVMTIASKGSNIIERSIYLINVADWASVYLAEMKEVDPVDIAVIDFLKDSLAKI